jgi:type IV conjugative transfer system coupling protein TraD
MSARKGWIHDFIRGWNVTKTQGEMLFFSFLWGALSLMLIVGVLSIFTVGKRSTAFERSLYYAWVEAKVYSIFYPAGRVELSLDGNQKSIRSNELLKEPGVIAIAKKINQQLVFCFSVGGLGSVGILVFYARVARKKGEELRLDEYLRGARIVDAEVLGKALQDEDIHSDLQVGNVPLIRDTETQHMMISGAPGTGKSVLIMGLLDTIRAHGQRVIIYDISGDFVERYYLPGDTILNPMDGRSPAWNPWVECTSEFDFERIAESLVPEGEGDRFWTDVARALVAGAMLKMWREGNFDLLRLLELMLVADMSELAEAVKGTEAASLITGDESGSKLAISIRASAAAYVRCLKLLPVEGKPFSIRKFIEEDGNGWLFISSRIDYHAALRPLLSCWLDCAAAALLSMKPDRQRRIFFVLDELPSLQKMPSIPRLLAMGRKYGAAGILGIQSVAQLREVYKKDGAEALAGLCSTHAIFRAPDPDTADWASRMAGERETDQAGESHAYSPNESRDAVTLNGGRKIDKSLLPSEISGLENLRCFLKLAGNFPITKASLIPQNRPALAAPYVSSDPSLSIGSRMGLVPPIEEIPSATQEMISPADDIATDKLL